MSLVDKDHMTELRTASEAQSTAATAKDEVQLKAIAFAINHAANTGEMRTIFQDHITDNNWAELESKGYTIKYVPSQATKRNTLISWGPVDHSDYEI